MNFRFGKDPFRPRCVVSFPHPKPSRIGQASHRSGEPPSPAMETTVSCVPTPSLPAGATQKPWILRERSWLDVGKWFTLVNLGHPSRCEWSGLMKVLWTHGVWPADPVHVIMSPVHAFLLIKINLEFWKIAGALDFYKNTPKLFQIVF
jgi:hypothetical protein